MDRFTCGAEAILARGLELGFERPKGFALRIRENGELAVRYGLNLDEVFDGGYTEDGERHVFGALPLETPMDGATESDGAVEYLTNKFFIPHAGTE